MWRHIKIPFRTPNLKLYEVLDDVNSKKEPAKVKAIQIESLYPKLVKQIRVLKRKVEDAEIKYGSTQAEKKQLLTKINSMNQEKGQLQSRMEKLEEKIEQLKNNMTQMSAGGVQTGASGDMESGLLSNEPKVYEDVEERLLDEHGQPGDLY